MASQLRSQLAGGMKALRTLFLALCLIAGLAHPSSGNQAESEPAEYCTTFDQKPGRIIHFNKCAYMMAILAKHKAKQQLSDRELDITRYSRRNNFKRAVCCEDLVNDSGLALLKESEPSCGEFGVDKVVGGWEIEMGSRPWMALLEYNDTVRSSRKFRCGATLITPRYLLTAAHCVGPTLISARLGEHRISTGRDCEARGEEVICQPPYQDIPVERAIVHRNFSLQKRVYDIALIRLRRPATIATHIKTICLPLYEEVQRSIRLRSVQHVTGWGVTDDGDPSDVPNETSVSRLSLSKCNSDRNATLLENQMCFSALGHDSCSGDSGGPLSYPYAYQGAQRFVQVGIVSYGPRDCGAGNTAVYTDVSSFVPWITQNIEP